MNQPSSRCLQSAGLGRPCVQWAFLDSPQSHLGNWDRVCSPARPHLPPTFFSVCFLHMGQSGSTGGCRRPTGAWARGGGHSQCWTERGLASIPSSTPGNGIFLLPQFGQAQRRMLWYPRSHRNTGCPAQIATLPDKAEVLEGFLGLWLNPHPQPLVFCLSQQRCGHAQGGQERGQTLTCNCRSGNLLEAGCGCLKHLTGR
jgi:hypothetical protein